MTPPTVSTAGPRLSVAAARDERARLAASKFRGMVPTLSGFARVLTGRNDVRVAVRAGTPATDGKTIFLRPPIELGDTYPHEKRLCGERDSDSVPRCPSCRSHEDVMITLYHEIAHIAYGSFEEVSDEAKAEIVAKAVAEAGASDGSKRAGKIAARIAANPKLSKSYIGAAHAISPFLPGIVNALEDVRVNREMYSARVGTLAMFRGQAHRVFTEGIQGDDGVYVKWDEMPRNAQAVVGLFAKAAGYNYENWFSPEVVEALDDSDLTTMLDGIDKIRSARGIYELAFPVLERLRGLGFLKAPDDPEDDEPEEDEPVGDPTEADEDDDTDTDTGGDDDSSGGTEQDADDDDDATEQEPAPGTEQDDDDATGPGTGSTEPTEDDDDATEDDDATGSTEPTEDDDDATEPAPGTEDDDATEDAGTEPTEQDDDDDATEQDDDDDDDDASSASDDDLEDSDGDDDGSDEDGDDDDTEAGDSGSGDADGETDDGPYDSEPAPMSNMPPEDDDETIPEPEPVDDSDLVEKALRVFGGHDVPEEDEGDEHDDTEDEIAVDRAIYQGEHFDAPSDNIFGVRVHKHDDRANDPTAEAWNRYETQPYYRRDHGVDMDETVPESILGPSLLRMRAAFHENKRRNDERNLKSGKVDSRVLGKRIATGDDRLMRKTTKPGKKDYFVLIGFDISGSTAGYPLTMIKTAVLAQAELCDRAGVKFAIYAHTGNLHDPDSGWYGDRTVDLEIYVIKDENEPWSKRTRQRLYDLGPSACNLDGHTLEFYRKRCDQSRATDKVILYYTDGAMPAENYGEELVVLQKEIKTCARKGYTLLGVGVGTDSPRQHGLDTVEYNDPSDTPAVIRHLEKRLR